MTYSKEEDIWPLYAIFLFFPLSFPCLSFSLSIFTVLGQGVGETEGLLLQFKCSTKGNKQTRVAWQGSSADERANCASRRTQIQMPRTHMTSVMLP